MLFAFASVAQKRTEYFPDGKKSFEGRYTLVYSLHDVREFFYFDTSHNSPQAANYFSAMSHKNQYFSPERVYDGKCTFYYDNGNTAISGNYEHGVKNGTFTYWYYDGKKQAEETYVNGMPDGVWQEWYESGKLQSQQAFRAMTEAQLDTLYLWKNNDAYQYKFDPVTGRRFEFLNFANDSARSRYRSFYNYFTEQESHFPKNTNWDGDFSFYYADGSKRSEMHYQMNHRTGLFRYWDAKGELVEDFTFADNLITDCHYYPGVPSRRPATEKDGATAYKKDDRIFTFVEQMPECTVDINRYLDSAIIYPNAAQDAHVEGRVIVKFIVNQDGTLSDFVVERSLGAGCDDEAVRVLRQMPKWKPGKQNGVPVRVYYKQPVAFKMK